MVGRNNQVRSRKGFAMNRQKRIVLSVLLMMVMIILGGCKQHETAPEDKKGEQENASLETTGNQSLGRFIEQDLNLPQGDLSTLVKTLSDKTLRAFTEKGVYESRDSGDTWVAWEKQPKALTDDMQDKGDTETASGKSSTSFVLESGGVLPIAIGYDGSYFTKQKRVRIEYTNI